MPRGLRLRARNSRSRIVPPFQNRRSIRTPRFPPDQLWRATAEPPRPGHRATHVWIASNSILTQIGPQAPGLTGVDRSFFDKAQWILPWVFAIKRPFAPGTNHDAPARRVVNRFSRET